MTIGFANGNMIKDVKDAINRFNKSSTRLSIFMLILALAQVFLGIMMLLKY